MRLQTIRSVSVIFLSLRVVACGQSFRNLDFEEAHAFAPFDQGYVSAEAAFPGWTVQATNHLQSLPVVFYDVFSMSAPAVILMPDYYWHHSYFALLQYPDPGYSTLEPSSISQIGVIPADARSIRFTLVFNSSLPFTRVTLNGVQIPLTLDGQQPPGGDLRPQGDVTEFAGRTAELKFTIDPTSEPPAWGSLFFGFDDIEFSPAPVPEPGSFSLLSLGFLLLRRKRH